MANPFRITGNGEKVLKKFFKLAPKAYQRTSAGMLNTLAFIAMPGMQETLKKDNVVRTPSLLRKAMRVEKASPSKPIGRQQSRVGSILTPRHDAFEAIDQGTPTRATTFTKAGRGGSDKGVAKKEAKAGGDSTEEKDFKLRGSGDTRTILFLQAIRRDKLRRKKAFYLPRSFKGYTRGKYKFVGGKVGTYISQKKGKIRKYKNTMVGGKMVKLSKPKAAFTPKRTNWNERTIRREITDSVVQGAWVRAQEFELRKVLRRLK